MKLAMFYKAGLRVKYYTEQLIKYLDTENMTPAPEI